MAEESLFDSANLRNIEFLPGQEFLFLGTSPISKSITFGMAKKRNPHLWAMVVLAGLGAAFLSVDMELVRRGMGWLEVALIGLGTGLAAVGLSQLVHRYLFKKGIPSIGRWIAALVATVGLAPLGAGWWPQLGLIGYLILPFLAFGILLLLRSPQFSIRIPAAILVVMATLLTLATGFNTSGVTQLLAQTGRPAATAYLDTLMNIPMVELNPLKDGRGKAKAIQYRITAPAMDVLERSTKWATVAGANNAIMVAGPNLNPDLEDLRKGYKHLWIEYAKLSGDSLLIAPRIPLFPLASPPKTPAPQWGKAFPWILLRIFILAALLMVIPPSRAVWLLPVFSSLQSLLAPMLVVLAIHFSPILLTHTQIPFSPVEWMMIVPHVGLKGLLTAIFCIQTIAFGAFAIQKEKKPVAYSS